jgi:S1-C subfamily serine protease
MLKKSYIPILFSIILFSCSTTPVQYASLEDAIEVPQGADAVPLAFQAIVVKLRRLEEIGETQGGWLCVPQGKLKWQGGRVNITTEDLTEVFRDELTKANYPIVGNPNALFDDPELSKAELYVAGMIKKYELNICYPNIGFGDISYAKGGAFIEVEWQIYNVLDRSVVYTTTTKGSFELADAEEDGLFNITSTAFAYATQNLLADKGFHDLVVRPKDFAEVQNFKLIEIGELANISKSFSDNSDRLNSAIVTVRTSIGHGSGVFVGNKGYLVTNQHVVGDGKFVRIILSTGREITGEVLRIDKARDLALITTGEKRIGLPFSKRIPNVGEEVFAIGSPLSSENSMTISKGIVSAFRTIDRGFEVIQSDVMVQPGSSGGPLVDQNGNILGITVSGAVMGGRSVGLNYFIPFYDVPKYLGLAGMGSLAGKRAETNLQLENEKETQIAPKASEVAPQSSNNNIEKLKELKNLFDQGLISKDVYEQKQIELISG